MKPVGLVMTSPVRGDFEITAGYQLLHADRPAAGYGVGFEIFIRTDTPTNESITFSRVVRVEEGDVYSCSRNTIREGKPYHSVKYVPTSSAAGRLRLTRRGAEVAFAAAENGRDAFQVLCRYTLGADDLNMVRIAAQPGRAPAAVDLRIVDLTICSGGPPTADDLAVPPLP